MTRHPAAYPAAYTAGEKPLPETPEQLRARIPGWGADLDPADRPSVPKLSLREDRTGAHWDFPDRQPEHAPRERSIEHAFLTPVFGTTCPPKGLSGALRKYAYRYSEARAAHWLILIGADRVDAVESHLTSFVKLRPDNPITETGVLSEFSHHGIRSRVGRGRADLKHQPLDVVVVAAPWLLAGGAAYLAVKAMRKAPAAAQRAEVPQEGTPEVAA